MNKPTKLSPEFERVITKTWENPKRALILCIIDYAAVICTVVALAARVALLAVGADYIRLIGEVLTMGISFVVVSAFRKIINMPRPYEIGNIPRLDSSKKRGESFPSRHVFSAFVIATVLAPSWLWVSVALFVMGSAMGTARVLMGRHFIKDVVAGAVIGIASGVIGLLII